MLDPFVFDQCDNNEEAIDEAMKKAREKRKKTQVVLHTTLIMRRMLDDYDCLEDYDDWSDEIYND